MHFPRSWHLFAAAIAITTAAPAVAATLLVNSSGQLTGATGVNVNGTLYDVTFQDTTCASAFSGCHQITDFNFQTQADASAAAQALLTQVFLDGAFGQFDTPYDLTLGCGVNTLSFCEALIPYGLDQYGVVFALAKNAAVETGDGVISGGGNTSTYDFSTNDVSVLARFTLEASAVPEPATWAMMLLGFGGIGCAMKRQRRRLQSA